MFLEVTLRRNPALVDAAVELHRSGRIGPNTFVIDIDRVVANARLATDAAAALGLRLHVMTKQQGRNPFMALAAIAGGIPDAVAVDVAEARLLFLHGVPIGNVGHLVQVPVRDTDEVLQMHPGVVTVFSLEAAARLAAAARPLASAGEAAREQPLLLRVWKPGDFLYPGQEGGFRLDQVADTARSIAQLQGVRVAGVTSFPCLLWNADVSAVRPTGNLETVVEAARRIEAALGAPLDEINAPGVTAVATLPLIAEAGATHGEPGSSLTGQTPLHAAVDQPEMPAMVYVSEVASLLDDRALCFGGGFYARSRIRAGLIAGDGARWIVDAPALPPEVIDYYGSLQLGDGPRPRVGDSVIFAFRSQVFVARCQVAAVAGLASGRPELLGICDQHGNLLGSDQLPLAAGEARRLVREHWVAYSSLPARMS